MIVLPPMSCNLNCVLLRRTRGHSLSDPSDWIRNYIKKYKQKYHSTLYAIYASGFQPGVRENIINVNKTLARIDNPFNKVILDFDFSTTKSFIGLFIWLSGPGLK